MLENKFIICRFSDNATKVQWCGRKFDHEVILKSKFVTTYRKLCKNIYCNILQYAIEFLQIYCILQCAINGILLHCIFVAIGLWFIGKGLLRTYLHTILYKLSQSWDFLIPVDSLEISRNLAYNKRVIYYILKSKVHHHSVDN